MNRPRVYIETTVISAITADLPEFVTAANALKVLRIRSSRNWWRFHRQRFEVVISRTVLEEVADGDPRLAERRLRTLRGITNLDARLTSTQAVEVQRLRVALMQPGAIPQSEPEDARHIAICAVCGVDYLITWNFKHLLNAVILRRIESICQEHGYTCPRIHVPDAMKEG